MDKTLNYFFLLIIFSAICSLHCKKKKDIDFGYEYYPIIEGKERLYDVTVITKDANSTDTITYQALERTEGIEYDAMGRATNILHVLYRDNDSLPYLRDSMWTQYRGDVYAERLQGNIRYLVLKFPTEKGAKWNGDLYYERIDCTGQPIKRVYEITNADTSITINGVPYDHCVFVLKGKKTTGICFELSYEIYAKNIGKIVQHEETVQCKEVNCTHADDPLSYTITDMRMISHNY